MRRQEAPPGRSGPSGRGGYARESDLEHESQLELDKAGRVPLRGDAPEVRAVDVGIRVVPGHVVERVDQIQPEFQVLLLRYVEAAQKVGVKLVLAVASQPVERVWEDAGMERIRLEVCRRHVRVGTG